MHTLVAFLLYLQACGVVEEAVRPTRLKHMLTLLRGMPTPFLDEIPTLTRYCFSWCQYSNPRPCVCQASTLPLSYTSDINIVVIINVIVIIITNHHHHHHPCHSLLSPKGHSSLPSSSPSSSSSLSSSSNTSSTYIHCSPPRVIPSLLLPAPTVLS